MMSTPQVADTTPDTLVSNDEKKSSFKDFTMDPGLIEQLVHRQNGTVATAIRELITNSIDAGANEIHIELTDDGFSLVDNGRGFSGREEVERHFGRFGTPHTAGDARYGRFRIGRAQIMAFGVITWRSGVHEMSTDIRGNGYGYSYTGLPSPIQGCQVEGRFYQDLRHYTCVTEQDLVLFLGYCDTAVYLNGKLISRSEEEKASVTPAYEDEFITIYKPSKGNKALRLYSDGIYVKDLNYHHFGISADCVSKKALELNTARNDVATHCPYWKSTQQALVAELSRSRRAGEGWTATEKDAAIYQLAIGALDIADLLEVPLVRDVRGKYYSVKQLLITPKPVVCVPTGQEQAGDFMASSNIAYAIRQADLHSWGVTSAAEFCEILRDCAGVSDRLGAWRRSFYKLQAGRFENLLEGINTQARLCLQKELSDLERAQKAALQSAANRMAKKLWGKGKYRGKKRKLMIGECEGVQAWTDGEAYIAIARSSLQAFDAGMSGLAYLSAMLLHEYMHDAPSLSAVAHDFEFFEAFHNAIFGKGYKSLLAECQSTLKVTYARLLDQHRLDYPAWLADDTGRQPITLLLRDPTPTAELRYILKIAAVPYRRRENALIVSYFDRFLIDRLSKELRSKANSSGATGVLTERNATMEFFLAEGLTFDMEDVELLIEGLSLDDCKNSAERSMGKFHEYLGDLGWLVHLKALGIERVERNHTIPVQTLATSHRYSSEHRFPSWSEWFRRDQKNPNDPEDQVVKAVQSEIRDLLASVSPSVRARLVREGVSVPLFAETLAVGASKCD